MAKIIESRISRLEKAMDVSDEILVVMPDGENYRTQDERVFTKSELEEVGKRYRMVLVFRSHRPDDKQKSNPTN